MSIYQYVYGEMQIIDTLQFDFLYLFKMHPEYLRPQMSLKIIIWQSSHFDILLFLDRLIRKVMVTTGPNPNPVSRRPPDTPVHCGCQQTNKPVYNSSNVFVSVIRPVISQHTIKKTDPVAK